MRLVENGATIDKAGASSSQYRTEPYIAFVLKFLTEKNIPVIAQNLYSSDLAQSDSFGCSLLRRCASKEYVSQTLKISNQIRTAELRKIPNESLPLAFPTKAGPRRKFARARARARVCTCKGPI
jgi:hypothetical protein